MQWLLGIVVLLVLIQFIPYGKDQTNPPVIAEPRWDSPRTKELFMRACGDCHSHETKWPWYAKIAPVSWLVYYDVMEGRRHFNVSAWGVQKKNEGEDAAEELAEGEMPPKPYLLMHPEARLSPEEKRALIEGLKRTFGEGKGEDEDED
ncbi:MAG: heme-binding domain-containing protein [Epsilonproteobacteria bacterium]|nr:heme-binding domain-containing protein [Campylobacterota bacterium]